MVQRWGLKSGRFNPVSQRSQQLRDTCFGPSIVLVHSGLMGWLTVISISQMNELGQRERSIDVPKVNG